MLVLSLLAWPPPFKKTDSLQAKYRGTYRNGPSYVDELPEDHEVNRGYLTYLDNRDFEGDLSDLDLAKRTVELYRSLEPKQSFEIVEVTSGLAPPELGAEFLGFDISTGFEYSALFSFVLYGPAYDEMKRDSASRGDVGILLGILRTHFRPLLNRWSLFDEHDTAECCNTALMSLHRLDPHGMEGKGEWTFEPVGLYVVHP